MHPAVADPGRRGRLAGPARARRAIAGVLALAAVIVAAPGCSAGAPSRDELVDALVTSGLSKAESICAADAVVGNLSDDEVAEIVERGGGGAPRDDPNDANDTMDKLRTALTACRDQATTTSTTTSTTTAPTTSTTTAPTSTTTAPTSTTSTTSTTSSTTTAP